MNSFRKAWDVFFKKIFSLSSWTMCYRQWFSCIVSMENCEQPFKLQMMGRTSLRALQASLATFFHPILPEFLKRCLAEFYWCIYLFAQTCVKMLRVYWCINLLMVGWGCSWERRKQFIPWSSWLNHKITSCALKQSFNFVP